MHPGIQRWVKISEQTPVVYEGMLFGKKYFQFAARWKTAIFAIYPSKKAARLKVQPYFLRKKQFTGLYSESHASHLSEQQVLDLVYQWLYEYYNRRKLGD